MRAYVMESGELKRFKIICKDILRQEIKKKLQKKLSDELSIKSFF